MELQSKIANRQNGLSLMGFIFTIAILAVIAVLGMKIVPSVMEYSAIRKALVFAKNAGTTVPEIRSSFDKQAGTGYIESVSGRDLDITRGSSGIDVSVSYQKKIGLFGPVSLVIDYVASTGNLE
jgi:hypothetical protein